MAYCRAVSDITCLRLGGMVSPGFMRNSEIKEVYVCVELGGFSGTVTITVNSSLCYVLLLYIYIV